MLIVDLSTKKLTWTLHKSQVKAPTRKTDSVVKIKY